MSELIVYPSAGHNSWIDLAGAQAHFEDRLHTDDWLAAEEATQATALLMAFRSLNELEFNLWWKLDKTLADRYTDAQKAEILAALKQAQAEEALHLLRYDTEDVGVQAVSLGGLLSVKLDPGENPPRHSQRALDILRPLLKNRAVARFR
ncbi:MAG: hypothetical protein ACOZF2_14725 [Thermodesulfobacteriota bacterium]